MTRQASSALQHRHFDMMLPHQHQNFYIISRQPRALENADAFLLPFSALIWNIISFSLICFGILFFTMHSIYISPIMCQNKFHRRKDESRVNFFIFTICKIAEPDPLPWFSAKWSAGKFLVFIWSMYSLLLVSFYNCNLRAHLSAIDHEKPIDTIQDVLDNGKRPWLMIEVSGTS